MNNTTALTLTGRNSSHFTRVARIFAHELGVPIELDVVYDLRQRDAERFGGHPALKIPTLHMGTKSLWGTENICRKLLELAGRSGDRSFVLCEHYADDALRCAQELVWTAMSTQVQLRMGIAVCKLPADNAYFEKATASLIASLAWLEAHIDEVIAALPSPRTTSVFEVTLFCLYEHLVFLRSAPLEPYPKLRRFCEDFSRRESAQATPFFMDAKP
ncbi:MAG: glutathione S-transferase N-terminal domain-containing protein [Myxococcales bacterium]|nr:glutathione S-transferase N-terminal domain-containing protein [Myxococcales bacterium]